MKIRSGFVSNSSSSSFIITGKDNISKAIDLINNCKEGYFDYYLVNSKLYTCCIHESYDFYNTIYDLANDNIGHHGGPYDDEEEVEGDRGVTSVYVPKYFTIFCAIFSGIKLSDLSKIIYLPCCKTRFEYQ